ncbi:MAG TPA: bifunctional riboflavin kinase/FAD synthetase [Candidatus Acidoferrum sp.]|nr:bifunctional riboflavin kinase/FAD synthetase [Candidatus Acidoferrum sp.]
MNVIHATAELQAGPLPVCLAIGVFDGVHLGHQRVILQAVADAARGAGRSVVITFDRHPAAVLAPARVPPLIYPPAKKLRVIASLRPDTACVIHFDKEFSQITGEEFIRGLARDCGQIHSLSVGRAFSFGRARSGNVALLKTLGKELGFAVHALDEVSLYGRPVSSTRVRAAVRAGRFVEAGQLLGRPYELCGAVIQGAGLGRQIGFPTANVDLAGLLAPPAGVYAARAFVRGRHHSAAVNIGCRPTVAPVAPQIQVEAHLLDFAGDLYGEEIELTFLKKLRDEQKFPSPDALRAQILRDIARVRDLPGDARA